MCGICGIVSPKLSGTDLTRRVKQMCQSMIYRGPDDEGIYAEGGFAMGARRLSIVDLQDGHQPFTTPDGNGVGVMNGEIYNFAALYDREKAKGYTFTSYCDTEVMLATLSSSGLQSVADLNGIFSLAYWNKNKKELFLARDHVGIKPLYIYEKDSILVFASELKSLMASGLVPKELNLSDISAFLSLAYIPGYRSPFKNVRMVPPGTSISFSSKKIIEKRYWNIGEIKDKNSNVDAEEIREILRHSIQKQLTGDVPIGLLLSAGLDSTIILNDMCGIYDKEVHTFTARFDTKSYDEGPVAALTAKDYHTKHHEIFCSSKDLKDNFSDIVSATNGLIANTAAFPIFMVSKLASEYLKVVMSGLGGDELFFGYPTYQADQLGKALKFVPKTLMTSLSSFVNRLPFPVSHKKVSWDYKLRKFLEGASFSPEKMHYWWRTILTKSDQNGLLLNQDAIESESGLQAFEDAFTLSNSSDFLHRASICDFETWLACMALPMNDNCSMFHSVEMRVPLLDTSLVEHIFSLQRQKRYKWKKKSLMKKVIRKDISDNVFSQPKQGFHIPLASWMCNDLKDFIQERLTDSSLEKLDFINSDRVSTLIKDHFEKKADNNYKLWNLLVLQEWHRQFV